MTRSLFTVADAVLLATELHQTQLDKAGKPYIFHPLRVWRRLLAFPEAVQMAGLLHDVIEDCGETYQSLRGRGVPPEAALYVSECSRRHRETYKDFIDRIETPGGIEVKLADLSDNLSPERLDQLDAHQRATLWGRYNEAQIVLMKKRGERRLSI